LSTRKAESSADLVGSQWLEELAAIPDAAALHQRMVSLSDVLPADAPQQVHAALLGSLYSDLSRAVRLAGICGELAALFDRPFARAFSARCSGHIAYATNEHENAVSYYQQALHLFDQAGDEMESARTLTSAIQPLILLGRYDQAKQWASRAESVFLKHGDALRLARLDSNVGNVFFRQDQPREAIARYQRALEGFQALGDAKDKAAALSNLAVCHTSLGQFAEAFSYYEQAMQVCERNGLERLRTQAEYNIAYLHYLRGEYREARKIYARLREHCQATGDAYHVALCDLDEAELGLELNLTFESEILARRAAQGFERLGMRYEQAKALVNLAVASSQRGELTLADAKLRAAHKLFAQEGNQAWPAMTTLLRAVVAFRQERYPTAKKLVSAAWRVLAGLTAPGRAADCQILLARLWVHLGHPDRARALTRAALETRGEDSSPSLRFHAHLLLGEIDERQGRWGSAVESYEAARREIEDLRGRVDTDDLRISILKDKLAVYESLVSMYLDSPVAGTSGGAERAMFLVQHAKSRSLADRLGAAWNESNTSARDAERFAALRSDLNWHYRQLESADFLDRAAPSPERVRELRARTRQLESELMVLRRRDSGALAQSESGTIARMQESLPAGTLLAEYFEARDVFYVFLLSRDGLEAVRLGSSIPVRQTLKLLQFQLGKFKLPGGIHGVDTTSNTAVQHHLRELYQFLIAPVESRLASCQRLMIAPHRGLHGLPFAALHDGSGDLVDRFLVSVIPSGSVLANSRRRRAGGQGALVLAVADPHAPQIAEEGQFVATMLPGCRLLMGEQASLEAFRTLAPGLRILHLAAHGIFRRDNPWFSSIRLADGHLSVMDLQSLDLNVDLVCLSACNTGSAVPIGGDELMGLVRGFLQAGARSLLASLWEIDDRSTMEFMRVFYERFATGVGVAEATREAMLQVRKAYPHPYHWAAFVPVGDSTE